MDNTSTELEIKAKAPSDVELRDILADFEPPVVYDMEDVYYDDQVRTLFRFGAFLRVRDSLYLDVKFNPDEDDIEHVSCEETRFNVPLNDRQLRQLQDFLRQFGVGQFDYASSLEELLEQAKIKPWVRIAKHRTVYKADGVEFCLDDVEGLGRFVEIEVEDVAVSAKYFDWAQSVGLSNLPVGYVELYLREHDWPTYIEGRYLFPDDRQNITK